MSGAMSGAMSCRRAAWRIAQAATFVAFGALAGCVDVPDSIRAQFAGPSPQDRSNYRQGRHGEPPPVAKSAPVDETGESTNTTGPETSASGETTVGPATALPDGGLP